MSFLKEFKEDLSQAVNELVNEDEVSKTDAPIVNSDVVDTISEEAGMINTIDEEAELDSLLNNQEQADEEKTVVDEKETIDTISDNIEVDTTKNTDLDDTFNDEEVSDETTDITKGTTIEGNVKSSGSVNLYGKIIGDVDCLGKLVVTGTIKGTAKATEIFANSCKIDGDVISEGSIKVGNGAVIIGNMSGKSAVIGGAVKGDIDVQGPVIVDATAVIKGNIKSKSVQINNGAVIDGFCSQCYADINYDTLFDETFAK